MFDPYNDRFVYIDEEGSKVYKQIAGIPKGTNCASLFAHVNLFYYERDFMLAFSDNNQAVVIEAFNYTSR